MAKKIQSTPPGVDALAYLEKKTAADPELKAAVEIEYDCLQLARQLRDARERSGLTQAQVAERMGTKQTGVARAESGRVLPRVDFMQKFATATGARLVVKLEPHRPSARRASAK